MKYFQHTCDRRSSPTLNRIFAEMRHEGECAYWRLLEVIGGGFDPEKRNTSGEFTIENLRSIFQLSPKKCRNFLRILGEFPRNSVRKLQKNQETYVIDIPHIAVMADEWTKRRLRELRSKSGATPAKEKEKRYNPCKSPNQKPKSEKQNMQDDLLAQLKEIYPRGSNRNGYSLAMKYIARWLKQKYTAEQILLAAKNYRAFYDQKGSDMNFNISNFYSIREPKWLDYLDHQTGNQPSVDYPTAEENERMAKEFAEDPEGVLRKEGIEL